MAKRKAKTRETHISVATSMPIPLLAFYEGVARYAGVSTGDAINVALAMAMVKTGAVGKSAHQEKP